MLAGQDGALESGRLQLADPLVGIEGGGTEDGRRLRTVTPFPARIGVYAVVKEGRQLLPLPVELSAGRNDIGSLADDFGRRVRRIDHDDILLLGRKKRRHGKEQNHTGRCCSEETRMSFQPHTNMIR